MKRALALAVSLVMLLSAIILPSSAAEAVSIDGGWSILAPEDPTAYESYASNKLREVLSEALGEEIGIVASASGRYIAVGRASRADVSSVAVNGYRISVIDGNVHISGTGQRGLQAGAYRFCEEFCGRKVYTSGITVLPKAEKINVPADTDIVYEPFFEYTDTDWISPRDPEYSMANGLNGKPYRDLTEEQGGTVDYITGFAHTMGWLCNTGSYAESHPEYLALHNGERTAEQPCLTNPDVLRITTEKVLSLLEERHDPSAPLQIVSVTQNDNYSFCECEDCKAFEAAHGGAHSATIINFVNQIADSVKAAGYDNVAVDTFAYTYSQSAPENIVPRDNVIVRLCSIFCCFVHPFDEKCNAPFMKDLEDWSKICKRLYVWDYATNYAHMATVFPNFNAIQRNVQILSEHNVRGIYVEGNYFGRDCDTEFSELRAYMISKCLQDPYCDLDSEIDGFLEAFYGPGGKYIKKIIKLFSQRGGSFDGHNNIYYGSWATMRRMTGVSAGAVDLLWAKAKKQAEGEQLDNILRSELSWRWWKASASVREFSYLNPCRGSEKEKLARDLADAGVVMLQEGRYEDLNEIDPDIIRYTDPDHWHVQPDDEEYIAKRIRIEKLIEKFPPLFAIVGFVFDLFNS